MITTALQFSGGKDSLATLHLWESMYGLEDTSVMWVNTGQAYPDVVRVIDKTRARVPSFVEVNSDVTAAIKANGYPSDVVPISNTRFGMATDEESKGPLIQSWASCCAESIWKPLDAAVMKLGCTRVVRGQRLDEKQKSLVRSGFVDHRGIEYVMPIQDWTEADVFQYLEDNGIDSPDYYAKGESTSRDCWSCTAFLHNGGIERIQNLPAAKRKIVQGRLAEIQVAVERDSANIQRAMSHGC